MIISHVMKNKKLKIKKIVKTKREKIEKKKKLKLSVRALPYLPEDPPRTDVRAEPEILKSTENVASSNFSCLWNLGWAGPYCAYVTVCRGEKRRIERERGREGEERERGERQGEGER